MRSATLAVGGDGVPGLGGARRLGQLLQVAGVLADAVVVAVVDDAELPHHLAADGRLYCPVVHVTLFLLTVELLHIEDLGAETVEDDANVFDGEMSLLVD